MISPCHGTNSPSRLVPVAAEKRGAGGSGRSEDSPQRRVIKGYAALGNLSLLSAPHPPNEAVLVINYQADIISIQVCLCLLE